MAKKGFKKNKSSSQKEEENSEMSSGQVDVAQESHKLGSVLRQIVDQIDDAERSNAETLQEMQKRLSSLSEQTMEARSSEQPVNNDALEKIENQIASLSDRIEIVSQGRSINADNLEERVEALASRVSSDDTEHPDETESVQHNEYPENRLIEEADITFAVTDQLEDDEGINPQSVSEHDTAQVSPEPSVEKTEKDSSEIDNQPSGYDYNHQIKVSGFGTNSHLEPQRLATLAEHFSPVLKTEEEEHQTTTEFEDTIESEQRQPADSQTEPAPDTLENRFAVIASRLEDTLAHSSRELQEREDISTKFDELAIKFESWLRSNDQTSSFSNIEQRIDALTDYVRKAEAHAARIDGLESQLVKLIDLIENRTSETSLPGNLGETFESIASRILEEKSVQIADMVATRMGKSLDRSLDEARLREIQESISAISAERKYTPHDAESNISAVNETLQSMSGRLTTIEEHIRLERAYADQELKKNTILEPELTEKQEDVRGDSEPDSFHDELELSMNEVIQNPSTLDLSDQQNTVPPIVPQPLFDPEADKPHFLPQDQTNDENSQEYVEAARRAAQAAFEKTHVLRASPPETPQEEESVLSRIIEKKQQIVEKGTNIKKRLFSFRQPSSTSMLVIGSVGLMAICFGILFKEISGGTKSDLRVVNRGEQPTNFGIRSGLNDKVRGRVSDNRIHKNRQETESGDTRRLQKKYINVIRKQPDRSGRPVDQNNKKNYLSTNTGNKQGLHGDKTGNPERTRDDQRHVGNSNESGRTTGSDAVTSINGMQLFRVARSPDAINQYNLTGTPVIPESASENAETRNSSEKSQYIKQLNPQTAGDKYQVPLPPEQVGTFPLRAAAASGNLKAQFVVGMVYLKGEKVKKNYPAAVRWLTRSASQSFAPAQYQLGLLYENGQGVPKDIGKAKSWYLRAANRGNIHAMYVLATLYTRKTDVPPNYREAVLWFKQAAGYGHKGSQYNLGVLYLNGLGVRQDKSEAHKWFSLARRQGDLEAKNLLAALAKRMSKDDLFRAEAELVKWRANTPNRAANLTEKEVLNFSGKLIPPFANSLVYDAQRLLHKLGYDVGPVDGQYGPKTRDAVKSFQLLHGMEATGAVTPKLISVLNQQS